MFETPAVQKTPANATFTDAGATIAVAAGVLKGGGQVVAVIDVAGRDTDRPMVLRMILDSLRYWVTEMHVDGFRFDLASVLSRDTDGHPVRNAPAVWDIESDPVLAGSKLIAEAWDAAGLYQVGRFVGDSWKEWNGRFRDDVRSFLRGDPGKVSQLANRLLASPDLYEQKQREPEQSVNFVTCHDGFTLRDLVSYERKRNDAVPT